MILDEIVATTRSLLEDRKAERPLSQLDCLCMNQQPSRDVVAVLNKPGISLIAEIKRASPSKGPIAPDLDAVALAQTYEKSGASAISVLTETEYFKGSTNDLESIREAVDLPILRKDFIIDPYQVWEARAIGSDLVLLIAAALPMGELAQLNQAIEDLAMTALIEVHNRRELEQVLELNPKIIGINNRNLADFSVSLETTITLHSLIPKDMIVVSESGIHTREDVKRLEDVGVNAILVGEALVKSIDPAVKIRELIG